MPLPNHNFAQGGKTNAMAVPAKMERYQIGRVATAKSLSAAPGGAMGRDTNVVKQVGSVLDIQPNQTSEDHMKKLSINNKSVGEMMVDDFYRMAKA